MKNNTKWMVLLIMSVFIISCSQDDDKDGLINGGSEIAIPINLDTRSLPADASCDLYIFSKQTGSADDYVYKRKESLSASPSSLRFDNKDLVNRSYRFLFVIIDGDTPQLEIIDKNTGVWNESLEWNNLYIKATTRELTEHNYYGIVDKTSLEIINEGSINAILTRMVGQFIIDIFKIDGSISNPVDIISDGSVVSVLDRVYKMDVTYDGMIREMMFDGSNTLVGDVEWGTPYTNTLTLNMSEQDFTVPIDDSIKELEYYPGNPLGSVRIKSAYLLPADQTVSCKIVFYYYDTTPKCGNISHAHDKGCYDQRTLTLNIPKENSPNLLSILPDYYTLSKGGIRYDRIIDLDQPGSFQLETMWGN